MNEIFHPDSAADVPWPTSDHRVRVPNTSMLPEDAPHAKTDPLRDTQDEWVERVRTTVRGNPLVSVAAAVTLGAVIARITR